MTYYFFNSNPNSVSTTWGFPHAISAGRNDYFGYIYVYVRLHCSSAIIWATIVAWMAMMAVAKAMMAVEKAMIVVAKAMMAAVKAMMVAA